MDKVYDKCCGIDVHKKLIVACFRKGSKQELRNFGATTRELLELANWLQNGGCEMVAMESTASYWKPLYNILESSELKAMVVNASHMKAVPGRKTDTKDAEWIAELLQHGLLKASYIPDKQQRELRELVRYRKSLVSERTRELNRLQKMLEGANIKLSGTVSDINCMSARNILEYLLTGEFFDEAKYDEMYKQKIIAHNLKASKEQIIDDLNGVMTPLQRRMMKELLSHLDELNVHINNLEDEIDNFMKPEEKLDLRNIPAPHEIKHMLDEYVVGQDYAKKVMSVAVYNHYKRVAAGDQADVEIEKSNMLMIGPTGSGKTYLVKTLARLLQVPLAIADATSLTEAGYIGDDIESVVSKLLAAADNDVERAEHGIIFIDEIDKIAKKKETRSRDVSGESVQQGMLKLLEGSDVEVPVGATSKNAMVPQVTVSTKNILFICGGAFPELDEIIKERLNQQSSIGFAADLKDKYDEDPNLLQQVTLEDLRNFGMIPEFLGRLPIIFSLENLTKDMLVKIMKEPRNAILKQYEKLLELDEVKLEFADDALEAIAQKAMEKKTGARALRSILEDYMLDIMYEIPKDPNIGSVVITRPYLEKSGGPMIQMRG